MRSYEDVRTDAEAIAYIERYTAPVMCEANGEIVGYDLDEGEYQYLLQMSRNATRYQQALEYIARNEGRIIAGSVAREALRSTAN